MKIEETTGQREITLTINEEEAKQLFGMSFFQPVSGDETCTREHQNFKNSIVDQLDDLGIQDYDRGNFITTYDNY
jgi:hypothetical protein